MTETNIGPDWLDQAPDAILDAQAFADVKAGERSNPCQLHRAARQHNWNLSSEQVRNWTQSPNQGCAKYFWENLPAHPINGPARLVTHRLVRDMANAEPIREALKANKPSPEDLAEVALKVARGWHEARSKEPTPFKLLWLADLHEVNRQAKFEGATLHDLLGALGLWHYGKVPGNVNGAVLRVVYEVRNDIRLFKPDWRHAYPNFYFAVAPSGLNHGLTRDLRTGNRLCQEWIANFDDLDAHTHIVEAQVAIPETPHNHHEPSATYWQTLGDEIANYQGA